VTEHISEARALTDDPRQFSEVIANDMDDLSAVVRTHTWIEFFIERATRKFFVDRNADTKWFEETEYTKRLEIAVLLGVIPEYFGKPLRSLAHLRNTFAHDPRKRIANSELDSLAGRLTGSLLEHYKNHANNILEHNAALSPSQARLRALLNTLNQMTYFAMTYAKREGREEALIIIAQPNSLRLHYPVDDYRAET
jgi:hypothetical protein